MHCIPPLITPQPLAPSAAISNPTSPIYQAAQQALKKTLSYGVKTIQQIMPCTQMYGSTSEDLEADYRKHRSKLLALIDYTTKLNFLRQRFADKCKALNFYSSLSYEEFAKTLKYGACQELSIVCSQEPAIADYYRYNFVLEGPLCGAGVMNAHSLIVISEKPMPLAPVGRPFINFIATCENSVVIDPYLQRCVASENILKDNDFQKELLSMQARKIEQVVAIHQKIIRDEDNLRALKTYLETLNVDELEPPKSVAVFVYTKRKNLILEELSRLFKHLQWKVSSKNDLWAKGTLVDLSCVQTELKDKGIDCLVQKVKDKEEYCLTFNFKKYKDLQELCYKLSV